MKPLKQWPKVLTKKSFKKRIYSYWQFWVLVLVLALGAWQASVQIERWGDESAYRESDARGVAEYVQLLQAAAQIDILRSADTYGGTTPQETWDMFVKALKAGDTDLASKYFVVWKQREMKEDWAIAKKNGIIQLFLDDFKLIIGSRMYPDGKTFELYSGSIDNGPGYVYILTLDDKSKLWKIKDL